MNTNKLSKKDQQVQSFEFVNTPIDRNKNGVNNSVQ